MNDIGPGEKAFLAPCAPCRCAIEDRAEGANMGFWDIGFLDKVIEKLPSWRGTTSFLYVASHWDQISNELEARHRYHKDNEELLIKLNERKIQDLEETATKDLAKQRVNAVNVIKPLIQSFGSAVVYIAYMAILYPDHWEVEKGMLDPFLRGQIDAVISVLPPPPKSFGEIFGGSPLGLAKALAKKKD